MKTIQDMIDDLDNEISRVKMFTTDLGYHTGTAQNAIVRRYRAELKALRRLMADDITHDNKTSYH
jgi:hypothetical protein